MARCDWSDLPADVREAVQEHTGVVSRAVPAKTGEHSDIAAALHTPSGRVFVKGARTCTEGPDLWSLRREALINPHVTQYAPRLLWEVEAGGWLMLGFEYVEARHADYTPGSADLPVLAKIVDAFQSMPCPDVVTRRVETHWADFTDDVSPMAGTSMLHMDLNPANLLFTSDDRVYVIDWGFARRGAAWVELATLIQWLTINGHSPQQAEEWVGQFPAWRAVVPAVLDLFADANAARWRSLTADDPPSWAVTLAEHTQSWAEYRQPRRTGPP
jgi:hypothetical protein